MDELLSIGRFARATGLTIHALRHYDELGLLAPARVDPDTGYRFYRREQAADARLIARLRELEVALPEVAAILAGPQDGRVALLARHRARQLARVSKLQRQLHQLNRIIDHREDIVATTAPTIDADAERATGVRLFNHVWTLLEDPDRTPEQDDEMLHGAHASRYHWGASGRHAEPVRLVIGEWQCSRVYAVLGRAEPALWHARRGLALCEQHGINDFYLGAAWEALARALKLAGDHAGAAVYAARARVLGEGLADPEEREILFGDLATLEG